mmetsp:Transcript_161442/g.297673  ORF Transcript_161442/g.297673 Transcript_161442/m.297673 type:complete len:415 (+) Transcript_161442:297-1541(+)
MTSKPGIGRPGEMPDKSGKPTGRGGTPSGSGGGASNGRGGNPMVNGAMPMGNGSKPACPIKPGSGGRVSGRRRPSGSRGNGGTPVGSGATSEGAMASTGMAPGRPQGRGPKASSSAPGMSPVIGTGSAPGMDIGPKVKSGNIPGRGAPMPRPGAVAPRLAGISTPIGICMLSSCTGWLTSGAGRSFGVAAAGPLAVAVIATSFDVAALGLPGGKSASESFRLAGGIFTGRGSSATFGAAFGICPVFDCTISAFRPDAFDWPCADFDCGADLDWDGGGGPGGGPGGGARATPGGGGARGGAGLKFAWSTASSSSVEEGTFTFSLKTSPNGSGPLGLEFSSLSKSAFVNPGFMRSPLTSPKNSLLTPRPLLIHAGLLLRPARRFIASESSLSSPLSSELVFSFGGCEEAGSSAKGS